WRFARLASSTRRSGKRWRSRERGVTARGSLLIATRSAGKLRELGPMIRAAGFEPVTLDDLGLGPAPEEESVEAFETFEQNALAKARYYLGRAQLLGVRAPGAVL